jgi:hypothetical protein
VGKSLNSLLNEDGFEALNIKDINEIERIINKGGDVFFNINPLVSELKEEYELNEFIWDTNQEILNNLYYDLAEEV